MKKTGPIKRVVNRVKEIAGNRKSRRNLSTPLAPSTQSRPMTITNPVPSITISKPALPAIGRIKPRPETGRDTPLPQSVDANFSRGDIKDGMKREMGAGFYINPDGTRSHKPSLQSAPSTTKKNEGGSFRRL
tara:strand:+ start:4018 stop:4413 length:396 start_codon:yes stop_codon:yes gene_type:complete